jgi:hypothetical protein
MFFSLIKTDYARARVESACLLVRGECCFRIDALVGRSCVRSSAARASLLPLAGA